MTGQTTIQDVLFFPQMRPEKAAQKDGEKEFGAVGVPSEWVPVLHKMSLLTVEAMRKIAPGKLFNDLCGFNKKNKLGLKARRSKAQCTQLDRGITPHTGFRRLRPRQRTTPSQHTPSVEPSYKSDASRIGTGCTPQR